MTKHGMRILTFLAVLVLVLTPWRFSALAAAAPSIGSPCHAPSKPIPADDCATRCTAAPDQVHHPAAPERAAEGKALARVFGAPCTPPAFTAVIGPPQPRERYGGIARTLRHQRLLI